MNTPSWLVLGVNNLCNLHCKMCDVGTDSRDTVFSENLIGTKPVDMPIKLFRRIASQAKEYFPQVKLGYAFTEPLIYRYFEESLHVAKDHSLEVAITTNGLKLEKKAEAIVDFQVGNIYLSLDGTQEIHNYIRGNSRSFQKAMSGIERLFSYKQSPDVSIFCVITEWNIGSLEKLVRFFSRYPISHLGFMHTNYTTKAMAQEHNMLHGYHYHATESNVKSINIEKMDLVSLWEEIQNIKKLDTKFSIGFSPELKSRQLLEVFYRNPEIFLGQKCNDVRKNIMIKSDGTVIPAHGRCFNLNIGNIYKKDILSIWQSQALKKLHLDLTKSGGLFPACARCCSAF